jgi:hypothetical protein
MVYEKSGPILSSFMKFLLFHKLRCSGFPRDIESMAEKNAFCSKINSEMGFHKFGLTLSPSNVIDNQSKRQVFKMILNSALGKFSLDETKFTET